MTEADVTPKFSTWSVPDHSYHIEYAAEVLEEIRQTAVEGYHRVPHGGVETGGILFGTHDKDAVRILAWRPIACEYSRGPSFLLSEKDEAALAQTLKSWDHDPRLSGMEPVGWYRAHTRSEVLLSDSDLSFFDRFFPQTWQTTLIVRPASFTPTRAGFFFREPDGTIRAQSSYAEFVLKPVLTGRAAADVEPTPRTVPAPAPGPTPSEMGPVPPQDEPHPVVARELAERVPFEPAALSSHVVPRRWYGTSVILLWAAAVVLLAVAGLGYWAFQSSRGLSLSVTEISGELRIAWDRGARPIRDATGGLVEIEDHGVSTEVKLTRGDLHSGNISYARQSGDVRVRLMIYVAGSSPVVEMTRFLRPGEGTSAPPAPQVAAKVPPPAPEMKPAPATKPAAETRLARVEPPRPAPERTLPILTATIPADFPRRPKVFRAPSQVARPSGTAIPAIAPPRIDTQPTLPQASSLTSVLGTAVPAPIAPPQPKTAAASASGRIIWTGRLPKNGRLTIEGRRASTGAISGALPAEEARVTAYPGDLTSGGITLFTADPKYTKPLTEAANADNGWNSTTYTMEPKRAAGIKVLEQPRPQNGYRLVLQSDLPKLSVIVLQWRAGP